MSTHIKAEIDHAIDQAMCTLTQELAEGLQIEEFDLTYEIQNSSLIEEILIDLREEIGRKAEEIRHAQLEEASKDLAEEWETYCLPIIKEECEQDGIVDGPARREDWCNFIDAKCRNGDITEWIAECVDADVEAL